MGGTPTVTKTKSPPISQQIGATCFFSGDATNPPPYKHFYLRKMKHSEGNPVNFTESVNRFIAEAYWLSDSHAPSVVALQALAMELDREVQAALVAQFGVLHRSLLKEKPKAQAELDPIAELLIRDL